MSMNVQYEDYYDTICAERGNYWSIREVGSKSQYQTSKFKFTDAKLEKVEIPIPSCRDMVNGKEYSLQDIVPQINGDNYWLQSCDGTVCTFLTTKYKNQEPKTVVVNWSLKVNNKPLK